MNALCNAKISIIFLYYPQELGDVENWSRVIEADMTAIASALEYAYKGRFNPC